MSINELLVLLGYVFVRSL